MRLLKTPKPRARELPYHEFDFPIVTVHRLPTPTEFSDIGFLDTMTNRRSERKFGRPLEDAELSSLLWLSCRTIMSHREPSRFSWEHRVTPSAGGRHPIHLLVLRRRARRTLFELYIPQDHSLARLSCSDIPLQQLLKQCDQLMNIRHATVIFFAAEIARTSSKYLNPESLIWRDAGALVATLNLAATALRLPSCALGLTCEPYISRFLRSRGAVVGVGGFVVGHQP